MLTRNMTLILPKIYIKSYFTTQMQLKIFWAGTVYRIMPVLNALELVINRISLLRAKSKFLLKKSHSQLVGNSTKNRSKSPLRNQSPSSSRLPTLTFAKPATKLTASHNTEQVTTHKPCKSTIIIVIHTE